MRATATTALPTRRVTVRGFTAIELMVTVAILGVLAALAAPSFAAVAERWRIMQTTESLKSTLYYARSEAIKRGGSIAIQKLANGTNGCTTASGTRDWGCGWYVCADTNGNGTCNASEPVLQRYDTPANVEVTRTGGGTSIKINRWGLVSGTWLGFSIVPKDQSTNHPAARGVCMSSGGRIRVIPPEDIPCRNN
ncbi:GspH/FimT family pseudopilin [[Acidovorax] ebreus]|uniref:Type II secretion system protein H n=1 Tax=Acidovorax ebreus (strain TPSY) TaxID=535289 RepID=A0A9J9UBD4_ACIET|nr:GspH/FimT family pseudopilin [[Acidovorax] ebreus]ACM33970.1 putative type-4 fimbrial pilin related signal peptide protein [[Acidovorax] ebreus TPSY]